MDKLRTLALVLTFSLLYGCSSPSSQTRARPTTDLGIVEMADRGMSHYALPEGRKCELRFTALADGDVLVEAVVLKTDAQGNVTVVARPRVKSRFGQQVTLAMKDESILLTPKRL